MDEVNNPSAPRPARLWRRVLWGLLLLALGAGAFVARCDSLRQTFIEGRIYFVDGDCYARMTRAQLISEHPGRVIHHHDFENFPEGVRSHTTAPFDYAIVLLKWVLDGLALLTGAHGQALWAEQTLDLAGAIISPLLGAATCMYLAWWARREMGSRGGLWVVVPLFFQLSPILVHGTGLGRPDHQAPVIGLLIVALTAELALLRRETRSPREIHGWLVAAGVAWGMALWISLFEPLLLLLGVGAVVALYEWLGARGQAGAADPALSWRERWREAAVLGGILGVMLVVEGSPIPHLSPEVKQYFPRWGQTVAELRRMDWHGWFSFRRAVQMSDEQAPGAEPLLYEWLGFGCLAAPVLLALAARRDKRAWLLLGLGMAMFAATWDHLRWGYFLGLVYTISLPWQLALFRRAWVAWLLVAASWYPLAGAWDRTLFPDEEAEVQLREVQKERKLLRIIATQLREEEGVAPFLAPWWLSPSLAYWSGQPGVAGSSHEGMGGIVDSARFYLAEKPEAARAILERRGIAFVVLDDPARTLETSLPLLGEPEPRKPMGRIIYEAPHNPPAFLRLRYQNEFYKLFSVDTTRTEPAAAPK